MENNYICKKCGKEVNLNVKTQHDSTCFIYPTFSIDNEHKDQIDNDHMADYDSEIDEKFSKPNQILTLNPRDSGAKKCPYCDYNFADGDFLKHMTIHEDKIKLLYAEDENQEDCKYFF